MRAIVSAALCCGVVSALQGVDDAQQKLPPVSDMMNASSNTLKRINEKVSKMSSHMAELAEQQQQDLAQLKSNYEEQLATEQEESQRLQNINDHASNQIWELEKGNTKLRQRATLLQDDNAKLRKALQTVRAKVGGASRFVNNTLTATDDSGAKELQVLAAAAGQAQGGAEDDKDDDADSDASASTGATAAASADTTADASDEASADTTDDVVQAKDDASQDEPQQDGAQALIALRARHRLLRARVTLRGRHAGEAEAGAETDEDDTAGSEAEADDQQEDQDGEGADDQQSDKASEDSNETQAVKPKANDHESQDLIHTLSEELERLEEQDAGSRKHMDQLFLKQFNAGKEARAKIVSKQRALNATKASLVLVQQQLQTAVHHLEDTKAKLEKRLNGLGQYLKRLSDFALSPAPEAEQLIPSLPGDVDAFLQAERRAVRQQALIQAEAKRQVAHASHAAK